MTLSRQGLRRGILLLTLLLLPLLASAHPASMAAASVKVDNDGSFTLRLRFDLLAFAANATPQSVSDTDLTELVDAPDETLRARLQETEARLRQGIDSGTALRTTAFPGMGVVTRNRPLEGPQRLLVVGNAVFTGKLPKGTRSLSFRFPESLDTVILTVELPYQEPISEPLLAGTRSRPIQIPSVEETARAAKALGITLPNSTPPGVSGAKRPASGPSSGNGPAPQRSKGATSGPVVSSKRTPAAATKRAGSTNAAPKATATKPTPSKQAPADPAPQNTSPQPPGKVTAKRPTGINGEPAPQERKSPLLVSEGNEEGVGGGAHPAETPRTSTESTKRTHRVLSDITRYIQIGFEHILPGGLDHVLFVLGLVLVAVRTKDLLAQVTAFTVAHSITLGLALFNVVSLPGRIVEPIIAASIAFVALENIWAKKVSPWRLGIVFVFGLIHGLGFAGALRETGLDGQNLVTALVGFNIGVELGQLTVVAAALGIIGRFRDHAEYRKRLVIPASALIAALALFWTVQRVFES